MKGKEKIFKDLKKRSENCFIMKLEMFPTESIGTACFIVNGYGHNADN